MIDHVLIYIYGFVLHDFDYLFRCSFLLKLVFILVQEFTQVLMKTTFKQVIKIMKYKIKHINQNMNHKIKYKSI